MNNRTIESLADRFVRMARRRGLRLPWFGPRRRPSERPADRLQDLWNPTGTSRLCLG